MKLYDKVRGRIPDILDIPDQTLPGDPIIEIYADRRVLIEGRCAVIQYGTSCIRVKNQLGIVCVSGCGLCMAELSKNRMVITGKIENLSIVRG